MDTPIPPRTAYTISEPSFLSLRHTAHVFTRTYMSRFDASHDYAHIERVVALSSHIFNTIQDLPPTATLDPASLDHNLITLAAILHDIGDHKYSSTGASTTPVQDFLLSQSCPAPLAAAVQCIVSRVSFSQETRNPAGVAAVLAVYPELGIVQDADRLDAIGAVGLARCFVFGSIKMPERGFDGSIEHFGEKLLKLGSLMKTPVGKEMAIERTRRLEVFEGWFREEVGMVREDEREVFGEGESWVDGGEKGGEEDAYEGFENI